MRICVIGAGAIGGLLGAKLALTGNEVTLFDQGAHLEAIKQDGLKLIWEDGREFIARPTLATDDLSAAGPQDIVVLALKAHFLEQIAAEVGQLVGPDTMIVTVQNGIPWWYFHGFGGKLDGTRLETVDPGGVLEKNIDGGRIIGCVIYPAASVPEPGVIQHSEGNRLPVGELDGRTTDRVQRLHGVLVEAGFRSRILDDIRSEIWFKAWGNLSFNPISALTHATLAEICQAPETRRLAAEMMRESQDIAEKLGVTFRHTIEKRITGAESVGAHKTSMLQDVELGRSLEIEALIGSVLELGRLTDTPAPSIEAVYACTKLLNRSILKRQAGVTFQSAAQ